MSATAFQRIRREAEAKAKASSMKAQKLEEQQKADIKLDDMSVEELTQYAIKQGIDIGSATSQKGILKKIKEAE